MFLYVSKNRLNELKQHYNDIAPLFLVNEQILFDGFLKELENAGYCSIEKYNNIYSILNQVYDRTTESKEGNNLSTQSDRTEDKEEVRQIDLINMLRMQFATYYYFSKKVQEPQMMENENRDVLRRNKR